VGEITDDTAARGCEPCDMLGGDRLEIETGARADGVELRLAGDLTLATAARFLDALIDVELSAPRLLVLDLRRLRFLDSAALRELAAAHKRSRKEGRRLVIVTSDGPIERLLAMTGLDRELETAAQPPAPTGA
jgi:anti-anti-sigma factor